MVEINIRLDGGRQYTDRQFADREKGVVSILRRHGAVRHRVHRLWMGQPRRVVAEVDAEDIPEAVLFDLAKRFRQACLAIYYPQRKEGCLVGPMAEEWVPFDLKEFERFDDSLSVNPVKRSKPYVKPVYVPSDDAEVERAKMDAMYARLRQVFTREVLDGFAPQQRTLTDNTINRVLEKDGPDALTVPRFEGIYELVTGHLWSPAFTAVFNTNNQTGVMQ